MGCPQRRYNRWSAYSADIQGHHRRLLPESLSWSGGSSRRLVPQQEEIVAGHRRDVFRGHDYEWGEFRQILCDVASGLRWRTSVVERRMEMNGDQIGGIIRAIMAGLSVWAMGHGFTDGAWLAVTGGVVALVTVLWSLYTNATSQMA